MQYFYRKLGTYQWLPCDKAHYEKCHLDDDYEVKIDFACVNCGA